MDGFHYAGPGGVIKKWDQVVAEIELEPGQYIVFAKAAATISTKVGYTATGPVPNYMVSYQASLELADHADSYLGSLKGDYDDPGDRWESFSLNLAGEITKKSRARLRIQATMNNEIRVLDPRISAIKLSDLNVVHGQFEAPSPDLYSKVLSASIAAGISPKQMRDVLASQMEPSKDNKK